MHGLSALAASAPIFGPPVQGFQGSWEPDDGDPSAVPEKTAYRAATDPSGSPRLMPTGVATPGLLRIARHTIRGSSGVTYGFPNIGGRKRVKPQRCRAAFCHATGRLHACMSCNAGVGRVGMKATLEREAAKENTPHTARMAHDQLPPGVLWSSGLATRSRVIGSSKRRRTAKTATSSHRSFWRLVRRPRWAACASLRCSCAVARASLRCGPRAPRRSMGSLRCGSM